MANLSHLLGNVYGDDDSAATTDDDHVGRPHADEPPNPHTDDDPSGDAPATTTASSADGPPRDTPDWASDERLDAAFGDWTAGEMPEMERDHREDLTGEDDPAAEPVPSPEPAESVERPTPSGKAELRELAPEPQAAPTEPVPPPSDDQLEDPTWELTHDDILPSRGGGVRQLLRRR